jgi:ferredoxin-type protein NapH
MVESVRLVGRLWQDRALRWEFLAGLLLTIAAVGGGAYVVGMVWWAALSVGTVYLAMYFFLAAIVRRESLRRLRRILLIGWGVFLWLGLVVGALATRGTTAYTAEVSMYTRGTPICNIGNLWIATGLLTRGQMLLGTTLLGFATTLAGWLGLTLFFGRGWCGWFCYLGVPLEIAALLRRRRGRDRLSQAIRWNRLPASFGYFRYAVLLSAVLLSAWLITPAFCWICPVRVLFDQWELRFDLLNVITAGTGIALFLATMVVGPMLTGKRVWCAYFCPLGAMTSLIAWLRARMHLPFVGARIDGNRCKRCLSCVAACSFNVISPRDVERTAASGQSVALSPDCTACGDCVSACPEGAIELASGSRPVTLPAVRRRAYVLALTFFVFLTAFLWAQFIPMFGPR